MGMVYRSLLPVSASLSVKRENAISLPSGEMATSSLPDSLQIGESTSPGVRSFGSPPAAGIVQMWLRLPSTQESQRRNGRSVTTRTFTGSASRERCSFSLQATSAQPG